MEADISEGDEEDFKQMDNLKSQQYNI